MKYHLRNLIFFLILFSLRVYGGDQTNLAVIDSLTQTIVEENLSGVEFSTGDTVALQIELEDRQKVIYCQQLISQILEKKSLTVFRNYNQLSSFHGMVIEISRYNATVLYSEPRTDGFLGENHANRTIQVHLIGQLFEAGDSRVRRSIENEKLFQDEIVYGQIEELEASEYGFTRGRRQGYSGWETYVEPFLVVSSVVVVVLLFFTQRN
jgi:hypothetical protein